MPRTRATAAAGDFVILSFPFDPALRQEQLPGSMVAKAFTHIQHERLLSAGRPAGDPERVALAVSSDYPEAVDLVTRLYDDLGYDTADHSPLSESWRTAPGQPAWVRSGRQGREELVLNLRRADPAVRGATAFCQPSRRRRPCR